MLTRRRASKPRFDESSRQTCPFWEPPVKIGFRDAAPIDTSFPFDHAGDDVRALKCVCP